MSTPSITPAQIVAALTSLVTALVVLFKLDLTQEQQAAAVTIIGTIVPVVWIVADSFLRGKRNETVTAAHQVAIAQLQNLPADGDDSLVDAAPPAGK